MGLSWMRYGISELAGLDPRPDNAVQIVRVAPQIRNEWKAREERRAVDARRVQQHPQQQRVHAPAPPGAAALGSIFKVPPRPGDGDFRARLTGPAVVYGFAR